jgi:HK97 family phage prohead protease
MVGIAFKNFESPIEDLDEKGIVTVYGNAFLNKDSDGDISAYGSFDKTIKENGSRIKHFLNHDSRLLIGVPLSFNPDEKGLLMRSKLNLNKPLGKDVYEDYKLYKDNGKSLEHSIGYGVEKRDAKNKSVITEYKLWEVSTLTSWGANPLTPLVDMKSANKENEIIQWMVKMYDLPYSDARLLQIETILKSLTKEPEQSHHLEDKPIDAYSHLSNLFKN